MEQLTAKVKKAATWLWVKLCVLAALVAAGAVCLWRAIKKAAVKVSENKQRRESDSVSQEEKQARQEQMQQLSKDLGSAAAKAARVGARGAANVFSFALKAVVTIVLILVTTFMMIACIFMIYAKTNIMNDAYINLEEYRINLSTVVYYQDRETGMYKELVTLDSTEKRNWVPLEDIPDCVEYAAVAIEDKRFYSHDGVDWSRTASAFLRMFLSNSGTYGGSTITQQLIKNVTTNDDVTVQRKLQEIFQALELEKNYTRPEIMEWYLNYVYFGHRCYGIDAASRYYFNKSATELTAAEAAAIIGITNNPSIYSPYVSLEKNRERQLTILAEMYDQGYLTEAEYDEACSQELEFAKLGHSTSAAITSGGAYSWFVDALIADVIADLMVEYDCDYKTAESMLLHGGYSIYCTIDPTVQAAVDEIYTNLDNFATESPNQLQSAIMITDPFTGNVVAVAGGVGEKTASRIKNRATSTLRPCGSSIKPLSAYSLAMELGYITPETLVEDTKYAHLEGTAWMPSNSNDSFRGIITIRTALARSVNTVAAMLIDRISPYRSYTWLQDTFHITTLVEQDSNYAPMSLGGLTYGVKLSEMAQAYSVFANNGVFTYNRFYTLVTDSRGEVVLEDDVTSEIAISDTTAFWIRDMLEDAVAYGTATSAQLDNMAVAGKTGTTSDNYDRWFVGMTPDYVAAVWVGYDYSEEIVWSGNAAPQIWKKVMALVCKDMEYKDFTDPVNTSLTPVPGVTSAYFTVNYVDEQGTLLGTMTDVTSLGNTFTLRPASFSGYINVGGSQTVTVTEDTNVFTFVYRYTG